MASIKAKLDALAGLIPPVKSADSPADSKSDDAKESAKWAAGKISRPAYLALGCWEKMAQSYLPAMGEPNYMAVWSNWFIGSDTNRTEPTVLWFSAENQPPPRPPERLPPVCIVDEATKSLLGSVLSICCYPSTGEFRVRTIAGRGADEEDPLLERSFLEARPPKNLRATDFARRLAGWESKPEAFSGVPLRNRLKDLLEARESSGYFDGRVSLTDKLADFHGRSDISVIATSFRTPALDQQFATQPQTAGELLKDIGTKEQLFLRWDGECLLVRHPAYWIFECSEPPETALLVAEKIAKSRTLTVEEYSDVAFALSASPDVVPPWRHFAPWVEEIGPNSFSLPWVSHCFDRLPKMRGLLLRFDPEPLERAYPALVVLASMTPRSRHDVFSGLQTYDRIATSGACGAPFFETQIVGNFLTAREILGQSHDTGHDDPRADHVWIVSEGDGAFQIKFGLGDRNEVTYRFTIHPNPPLQRRGSAEVGCRMNASKMRIDCFRRAAILRCPSKATEF